MTFYVITFYVITFYVITFYVITFYVITFYVITLYVITLYVFTLYVLRPEPNSAPEVKHQLGPPVATGGAVFQAVEHVLLGVDELHRIGSAFPLIRNLQFAAALQGIGQGTLESVEVEGIRTGQVHLPTALALEVLDLLTVPLDALAGGSLLGLRRLLTHLFQGGVGDAQNTLDAQDTGLVAQRCANQGIAAAQMGI